MKARLKITFDVDREKNDPIASVVGNPLTCEVLLVDKKNKIYKKILRDFCMETCPWRRHSIHKIDASNKFEVYLNQKKGISLKNIIK